MRRLIHLPLSPFCRKIRLVLEEKGLDYRLVTEKVWLRRPQFLAVNPAGTVPVFIDDDGTRVCDSLAIGEYLEERYADPPLMPVTAADKAEVRRLVYWFDLKFHQEVTANLLYEKVNKRLMGTGTPDSQAIRAGLDNIKYHLEYIGWLVDRRNWLAGDTMTMADLSAAAHLSCLDYIGNVPWDRFPPARDWYQRLKSRKSFRPLLADAIPGIPPPAHYADLDF
ncbi:MAG: glutathione S-transferase family protein [Alphaproteobacteria bacterium]|nr:glutathione S-transferase family protein [Alphaproteobacteria bacterium]MDX5368712.1 glutathione S-transferase family protein [Alphaproteobacteria bacterium]MDX5463454.1 glutathione S-transferase family protein [Alphaproteobacteria bacterium]